MVESARQALTELYRQTGGDRWTRDDGWLSPGDPCTWTGITCDAGRITQLALPENGLAGTLPTELGLLAYLTRLDLSGNRLSGQIPPELGHARQLAVLDLSDNQLRGPLPERLRLLRRLRILDLHRNDLSGPIPAALRDLTALEHLDLSANRFTGTVPPELGRLTRLVHLALDHNPLSGPLPLELIHLTTLAHFSFNQTRLQERPDPAFQAWLDTIDRLERTGLLHAEVVSHGGGNLGLAALASASTLGAALGAAWLVALPLFGPLLGPIVGVMLSLTGTAGAGLVGKRVYELTRRHTVSAADAETPTVPALPTEDAALREALRQELRTLVVNAERELPPDVAAEVRAIEETLHFILARLERLSSGDADAYVIRQTIRDYLPEALAPYRAMPADFAQARPLQAGKTAHDHLLQQLETLHGGLQEIAAQVPEQDAQRLLVHGRFLRQRFQKSEDWMEAEDPG